MDLGRGQAARGLRIVSLGVRTVAVPNQPQDARRNWIAQCWGLNEGKQGA